MVRKVERFSLECKPKVQSLKKLTIRRIPVKENPLYNKKGMKNLQRNLTGMVLGTFQHGKTSKCTDCKRKRYKLIYYLDVIPRSQRTQK